MMKQKIEKTADEKMWNRISRIPAVILVLLSGIDIVRFAILGDKTAFITFSMIAVTFMLVAYMAWKSKMPFLYLVIAAAAFVLYFNTNFSTSTYYFNWLFLVESIIAALGGILNRSNDREKNPCGACGSFAAFGSCFNSGRFPRILESKV